VRFYLGSHEVSWLADPRFSDVPLFVSRRRLFDRKTLPRACGPWSCDSGGFTELSLFGGWTVPVRTYAAEIRRFRDEIGGMEWAAPQDWMCEPQILARTGLTLEEHQARTVANFLELRSVAPDLPWIPVLQGWGMFDYLRCRDLYAAAGVDLTREPLVGVGTVCRRQGTVEAERIMRTLAGAGLTLHGFGFKIEGLRACGDALGSADSLAWSAAARRHPPIQGHDQPGPGRPLGHQHCNNCADFALAGRRRVVAAPAF